MGVISQEDFARQLLESVLAALPAPRARQKPDFRGLHLPGVDASDLDLRGAYFSGANLQGANLVNADLRGCIFNAADLTGASLRGAQLDAAIFTLAKIDRVDLRRVSGLKLAHLANTASATGVLLEPEQAMHYLIATGARFMYLPF